MNTERRVALGGPLNFRDLGGYTTADGRALRWGRLFRSDSLHHLTDLDGSRLQAELGIRSALDFRANDELVEVGIGRLGDLDVRHVHLPTTDKALNVVPRPDWSPPSSAAEVYLNMMEHGGGAYAAALETLAAPENLPAVFFCMAGKDRTGLLSALVLSLLGVPEDTVVADYALSGAAMTRLRAKLLVKFPNGKLLAEDSDAIFSADPANMVMLFAHLKERYGSVRAYASAIGVPDDVVERLREAMLEHGS